MLCCRGCAARNVTAGELDLYYFSLLFLIILLETAVLSPQIFVKATLKIFDQQNLIFRHGLVVSLFQKCKIL